MNLWQINFVNTFYKRELLITKTSLFVFSWKHYFVLDCLHFHCLMSVFPLLPHTHDPLSSVQAPVADGGSVDIVATSVGPRLAGLAEVPMADFSFEIPIFNGCVDFVVVLQLVGVVWRCREPNRDLVGEHYWIAATLIDQTLIKAFQVESDACIAIRTGLKITPYKQ